VRLTYYPERQKQSKIIISRYVLLFPHLPIQPRPTPVLASPNPIQLSNNLCRLTLHKCSVYVAAAWGQRSTPNGFERVVFNFVSFVGLWEWKGVVKIIWAYKK
jgi:hypothetical protein